MVRIKPFAAVRPPKQYAEEVAARPYDVLNSVEAKAEAGEKSLLHITKPEIDFDPIIDEHTQPAYDKAVENFSSWQSKGWLVQDEKSCYYVYAQTMEGRTQYGLVVCAHTDDYAEGKIKKHELTRKDKEDDRMIHVRIQDANIEPVFFAYPDNAEVNEIVDRYIACEPEYNFTAEDGFGHHFWVIDNDADIERLTAIFAEIPAFYVADGHHRTAAAARVGAEKKENNPAHTGEEEYNWFMTVVFPDSQLKIIDYNRVVKDLNGLTPEQLVSALSEDFDVKEEGCEIYKPGRLHEFSMYLGDKWYSLIAKEGRYDDNDPIGVLDVTILSNLVLDKILGIKDLRTDKRIDFVGGIRGLDELERRVHGDMQVAFAMILLMAEALNCLSTLWQTLPISANCLGKTRWGAFGEAAVNIVVSLSLIWWNPLLGVAIGTLAAEIFKNLFYLIYGCKKILHMSATKELLRFGVSILVLVGLCAAGILTEQYVIHTFGSWALWSVFCVICCAAIAIGVYTALFPKTMKALAQKYLRRRPVEKAADRQQ